MIEYFFPFFSPVYNSCLSPGYFIARTLNTARPSFSKKEKYIHKEVFSRSNTGSFFGPYKEEETKKL